ncbi:hypothetical protein G4B88_026183 [Cannabis sativa]|uniref:CASP-like protein n=1 Tax=Cannabis sativa TaxID=3483 RepID=A0A7J6EW26_CANSA|nr:hypothetical protein G4B88_026183 [Cannabis sativa]
MPFITFTLFLSISVTLFWFFSSLSLSLSLKKLPMETNQAKLHQNPPQNTKDLFHGAQICLRILAFATTLAATWTILTSKQTILIIGMSFSARYSYSPALKFLALANGIACAFSAISFVFVVFLRRTFFNPANYFFLFLHDLVFFLITRVLIYGSIFLNIFNVGHINILLH